jgi:hypothetical protein
LVIDTASNHRIPPEHFPKAWMGAFLPTLWRLDGRLFVEKSLAGAGAMIGR